MAADGVSTFRGGANFDGSLTVGKYTDTSTAIGHGIAIHDLRDIVATPDMFGGQHVNFYFDQITDSFGGGAEEAKWMGIMHVKGWNGDYAAWQLAGNANNTSVNDTLRYRQGITQSGTTSWGVWQSVLTDNNFSIYCDARYVNATGDSMTGVLHLKAEQYEDSLTAGALNLNNSNIYGVNSIYMADLADGSSEGIHYYRDTTHVDSLWAQNGTLYFTPNREVGKTTATNYRIIHSGGGTIDGTLILAKTQNASASSNSTQPALIIGGT